MDCYAVLDCQPDTIISNEQRKQCLDHLTKIREEWQVKQSDQALRLYLYFLSRMSHHPIPTTDTGKLWEQSLENMVKVLRLKHMALNSEKTYITWCRQFKNLLIKAPPVAISLMPA